MYFLNTKNEIFFVTLIRREIYLTNHLKINMLIDNDVIDSKDIVINSINKKTFIRNCDVKMLVEVRTREIYAQQRLIHTKKTITFLSRNQLIIFVHYLVDELSLNRDFLFELNDIELSLYVHSIDAFTKTILVVNDTNEIISISRNFRLNKLIKFDYFHVFHKKKLRYYEINYS